MRGRSKPKKRRETDSTKTTNEKKMQNRYSSERRGENKTLDEPIPLSPALSAEEKRTIPRPEPLPMTAGEVKERGWSEVDFVFVTGDAYVDHPSFAAALLARLLEAEGFRIAMLPQPNWQNADPWRTFGRPRLGFLVSAGNMDSMINHYTANRKIRNDDAYSPDGKIGLRPDRATLSYCQRAREAYPGINIIAGGVEASLRRFAHYDYWSDKVKRSILMDSKAGMLSYGMGETALPEIARRLDAGETLASIRDLRGTVYRIGKTEDLPEETETLVHLPSFEEVQESKKLFAEMARVTYLNLNPYNAKVLVQEHGEEAIVVNPPSLPLTEAEMDRIYALPFTRKPHPAYGGAKIPALEVVKDSVTILRGCFGGCAFCSITAHQGKFVQSRSEESILSEIKTLAASDSFDGTISDLGGPTANMYRMGCSNETARKNCRRPSCLHPEICENLQTDHRPLIDLYRKARAVNGIKNIYIASGVRTDLALQSPEYISELVKHHIGGILSTAPEHTDPEVLNLMQKPPIEVYEEFCQRFAETTEKCGKTQYLAPYLIAGLPGSDLKSMVEVAEYLKANGICPQQVQDFIPTPFELAGTMYHTGMNPLTGEKVYIAKGLRERRLQHALLMYYNTAYYHDVKSALKEANREDLIGNGPNCLIPPYPPKIDNLRRTSRVKRLKKETEAERAAKEKVRAEWAEKMKEAERKSREERNKKRRGGPEREGRRDDRRGGLEREGRRDDRRGGPEREGRREGWRGGPEREGRREGWRGGPERDNRRGSSERSGGTSSYGRRTGRDGESSGGYRGGAKKYSPRPGGRRTDSPRGDDRRGPKK